MPFLDDRSKLYSGKLEHTVKPKKWTHCALTFITETNRGSRISLYSFVDGEQNRDIVFPSLQLSHGPLKCFIGGCSKDSSEIEFYPILGPIGVYHSLSHSEISAISDVGPCASNILDKYIFFINMHEQDHYLSLIPIVSPEFSSQVNSNDSNNWILKVSPQSLKTNHSATFTDILVNRCNIDILLPLFAQWDLTYENGERISYFIETTLDILENALKLSQEAQKMFAMNESFVILSHLLLKSSDDNLNYNVYNRFFNIIGFIRDKQLQKQFLDTILMNVELWLKCDVKSHQRIIQHWAQSLVPNYHQIVSELRPFSWILSTLRTYYWCVHPVVDLKKFQAIL